MSSSAKGRRHEEKMKKKRAIKAAKAAKYAALKGTSQKQKRQKSTTTLSTSLKHSHAMADCGNIGCQRCHKVRL